MTPWDGARIVSSMNQQEISEYGPRTFAAYGLTQSIPLDDKWTIDFSLDGNETIGLATVYRVLTQFESAGIVERHNFDDGRAVFEMATEHHHDHMVDVDSGKVLEFVDERIERIQREIAAEHGFELVDHQLVLYVRRQRD